MHKDQIMVLSKELFSILVCPQCKGGLILTNMADGLICDKCRLVYEIRDDIPIMLIDKAQKLDVNGPKHS